MELAWIYRHKNLQIDYKLQSCQHNYTQQDKKAIIFFVDLSLKVEKHCSNLHRVNRFFCVLFDITPDSVDWQRICNGKVIIAAGHHILCSQLTSFDRICVSNGYSGKFYQKTSIKICRERNCFSSSKTQWKEAKESVADLSLTSHIYE